jgi:hypothetical protein
VDSVASVINVNSVAGVINEGFVMGEVLILDTSRLDRLPENFV